jgi:hypothetical protein
MLWMFRIFLRLYQREYRLEFGDEMIAAFAQHSPNGGNWVGHVTRRFCFVNAWPYRINAAREQPASLHFMPVVGGHRFRITAHGDICSHLWTLRSSRSSDWAHQLGRSSSLSLVPLFFLLSMQLLRRLR